MPRQSIEPLRAGERIGAIDGLRGIAILLVLFNHYLGRPAYRTHTPLLAVFPVSLQRLADMTWCGVDLFFVLSGFLIGGILLDHQDSPRLWRTFYFKRMCRIFPAYFLLIGLAFYAPNGPRPDPTRIPTLAYVFFLQNFWVAVGTQLPPWLIPTWTLAIEEQFYWLAPPLIASARRRVLVTILGAMIVVAFALRCLLTLWPSAIPWSIGAWPFTPCRIDGLAIGVVGAWLVRDPRARGWLLARTEGLKAAGAVLLAAVVVMSQLKPFDWNEALLATLGLTLLATLSVVAVLIVMVDGDSRLARVCRSRLLTVPGKYSYFLYLFHSPVLVTSFLWKMDLRERLVLCALVTSLLAWLSWWLYEYPFIRLGRRMRYQPARATPIPAVPVPG